MKNIHWIILSTILFLTACGDATVGSSPKSGIREVPAGYIGKVLTPTGWQNKIIESGQVDIGMVNNDGQYSSLVLLESTTATIKEQFLEKDSPLNKDKQDHRVVTKNGTPIALDFYIRVAAPTDEPSRTAIFSQVTPQNSQTDRVQFISLESVYEKFVQIDVRGKIREVIAGYEDYKAVMSNVAKINTDITDYVTATLKKNGAQLRVLNGQLSNIKQDQSVWDAENQLNAATAKAAEIAKIGAAIHNNPEYLKKLKWDTIREVGKVPGNLIITTGSSDNNSETWAAAKTLERRLKASPGDK